MVNETFVNVTNLAQIECDLAQIGHNTTLTNYLLIFIIFSYFCLLFFRNVGRVNNSGKWKR
jgi:hypothetical protein